MQNVKGLFQNMRQSQVTSHLSVVKKMVLVRLALLITAYCGQGIYVNRSRKFLNCDIAENNRHFFVFS